MKRVFSTLTISAGLLLAACSSDSTIAASPKATETLVSDPSEPEADATAPESAAGKIIPSKASDCASGKTLNAGKLVVATGDPAVPPYVLDNKPESGEGFEAAIARAVAFTLGFNPATTSWIRTPVNAATAPGAKDFDFSVQQHKISHAAANVVDFSNGYYDSLQAIFGLNGSPAQTANSNADLKELKFGAVAGTSSAAYVKDTIKPDTQVHLVDDDATAKASLESKQIDAIIADLPTSLSITLDRDAQRKDFRPDRRKRHRPVRPRTRQRQRAYGVRQPRPRPVAHQR
jgi:polar amino acid transport system substrate-binding protein